MPKDILEELSGNEGHFFIMKKYRNAKQPVMH
jgi:hypothetical protein